MLNKRTVWPHRKGAASARMTLRKVGIRTGNHLLGYALCGGLKERLSPTCRPLYIDGDGTSHGGPAVFFVSFIIIVGLCDIAHLDIDRIDTKYAFAVV